MADGSKIEWTDATWNPVTGCSVLSAGCSNCYAMRLAGGRMRNHPSRAGLTRDTKAGPVWTGESRWNQEWLDQPLRWNRPRRVFVCAHADLFHDGVTNEQVAAVFAVMAACPQHQFQVLTKRPKRAWEWFRWVASQRTMGGEGPVVTPRGTLRWKARAFGLDNRRPFSMFSQWEALGDSWPLPNVWLGVSVEDQATADERVPWLLSTPAAVRWVSYEPALGPVDFDPRRMIPTSEAFQGQPKLDWIVAGGESGPGARPAERAWFRQVRDWCQAEGVPFLFKQWGAWAPALSGTWFHPVDGGPDFQVRAEGKDCHDFGAGYGAVNVGKAAAGRHLDGRTWDEYPGQVAP